MAFILYHWSPRERRESILRKGLCPGSKARHLDWNPPYVCFSRSPSMAWALSAMIDQRPMEWDLWMVWSSAVKARRQKWSEGREYRVFHRIPKRDIWLVGTREYKPRKSATVVSE